MRSTFQSQASRWRWAAPVGLVAALTATGLVVAACQAQVPPAAAAVASAPAKGNAQSAVLLARIRAEIGAARCDSDAHCRTVAVGEKACGGPQAWLPWSTTTSDAGRLAALSAESVLLSRERQAQNGMASNCRYNADPGAQCEAGACVLRTAKLAN